MLTVIMECRDQETGLAHTLSVLVAGAIEGLVSDVIVLDHGSTDGSSRLADSAGCRFYSQWDMADVIRSARGEWLLLLEPGARPQNGWIEEIMEYVTVSGSAARFAPSRVFRPPFLKRILRVAPPLECGFLLQKSQAADIARADTPLSAFPKGVKALRLGTEIIPSWVVEGR